MTCRDKNCKSVACKPSFKFSNSLYCGDFSTLNSTPDSMSTSSDQNDEPVTSPHLKDNESLSSTSTSTSYSGSGSFESDESYDINVSPHKNQRSYFPMIYPEVIGEKAIAAQSKKRILSVVKGDTFNGSDSKDISKSACTDPTCSDANCLLPVKSECTDPDCGCESGHINYVRHSIFAAAGVLVLMMIGYMTYIRMKSKQRHDTKSYLPTSTKSETIKL